MKVSITILTQKSREQPDRWFLKRVLLLSPSFSAWGFFLSSQILFCLFHCLPFNAMVSDDVGNRVVRQRTLGTELQTRYWSRKVLTNCVLLSRLSFPRSCLSWNSYTHSHSLYIIPSFLTRWAYRLMTFFPHRLVTPRGSCRKFSFLFHSKTFCRVTWVSINVFVSLEF